jgi:hypothetical protein
MTIFATEAPTLEAAKLRNLGTTGSRSWLADDEHEYQVLSEVHPAALGDVLPDSLRLIHSVVRVPGSMIEAGGKREARLAVDEDRWHKAKIMPLGSYAAAAKREEWRASGIARRKAPQPARPLLNEPTVLQGREATRLPFMLPEPVETTAMRLTAGIPSPGPATIDLREHPRIRGRQALMDWLANRGVRVELINGHVLASARLPAPEVREVLQAYGRLLPSWVVGQDVPCDRCSAPAVAPALLDVVLCAQHTGAD